MRAGSDSMPARDERGARPRRWLPALLLAVPICSLANTSGTPGSPGSTAGTSPFERISSIIHGPSAAPVLADRDDQDRPNTPRRWYRDNPGNQGQRGWNAPEQRNRIEERRRFEALPPNQQQRLIQTRERFLNLPPETRDRLRQRWQDMSPEERRRWRESMPQRDSQQRN